MLILGRCHCGNISFRLTWEPDPVHIPARMCGCSFCLKHGGAWTSNPGASLRVAIQDPAQAGRYEFGTGNAAFHVCAKCGVVPVVSSVIDGRVYAVVSVNAFENVDRAMIRREPADFDGEQPESRRARWQRNWISDVQFIEGAPPPPL